MLGLRHKVLAAGGLAAALAALPAGVVAIQAGTLGAYPTGAASSSSPWFQYRLGGGGHLRDSLTVANSGDAVADVTLYPVDAVPAGDGGFGMLPQSARPSDAGSWIRLDQTSLRLPPHATQAIGFNFDVPAHPSVGPHYAGIIVQPVRSHTEQRGGVTVNVISRLGVRLYETVPGAERPGLIIKSLRHRGAAGRQVFDVTVRNTGNTILAPAGRLIVSNLFGRPRSQLVVNLGRAIKPGDELTATMPSVLATGGLFQPYTARLNLRYGPAGHTQEVRRDIRYWSGSIIIWVLVGLALLLATLLSAAYRRRRRRRLWHNEKGGTP